MNVEMVDDGDVSLSSDPPFAILPAEKSNILEEISKITKDQLGLESLRTFQIPVVLKACEGKSVLMINKCGSGKSVTFTISAIYTYKIWIDVLLLLSLRLH